MIGSTVTLTKSDILSRKVTELKNSEANGLPAGHLAETRLPALDGIRGVAVLMILMFHYLQGMLPCAWLSRLVRPLYFTQTGVDLFFVLSGFLITGILLNAKGTSHFLKNFYIRRVLRILPLYYLLVFGYIVAGWFSVNPNLGFEKCWWYLLYLQNIGMTFWPGAVGGPGHFWSLGVEEHFYLLWPILILLCKERSLPRVLVGMIIGGIACRVLLLALGFDVFTFSLCRMDALSAGALLAVVVRRPELAREAHRMCRWILLILGPVLLILYPLTSGKALFAMQVIKYFLVAVAYTALLGATVGPGRWLWLEKLFCRQTLRWCGKYSYAMYVFHPLLYGLIMGLMRSRLTLAQSSPALFMAIEFPAVVAAVCFVSWLSWHLFEKHFLKLKSRFEYSLGHQARVA
jgi:peptidoglycan/LPS O-acetylase OafA/YrhL